MAPQKSLAFSPNYSPSLWERVGVRAFPISQAVAARGEPLTPTLSPKGRESNPAFRATEAR